MNPAAPAGSVTARAPAKVNLHLGVGPLRRDRLHELLTVYHAVSLYDEVVLTEADEPSVEVYGEGSGLVPLDDTNLAVRAVRSVADILGVKPDVAIALRKGIPVAAGLAGGSADAAAAMIAADDLWHGGLDRIAFEQVAASIGSDIGFLLQGGNALGTGRGEVVSPVLGTGAYHWVLAIAPVGLSTAAVYAELDRMRDDGEAGEPAGDPDAVLSALRAGDPVALGTVLRNDLQAAAFKLRPQLRRVVDTARELGATGAVVSGSGPTVAMLARTAGDAVGIASALSGMGICRTVRRADGPVAGARIIEPDAVA
jgi:4-diphosphocytidyl-2-C-methyl-D-erythritol kinase